MTRLTLPPLTLLAAALVALTLPLDAPAQTMPTAEQCNDRRLFTMEKRIFVGDGTLFEGVGVVGRNGFEVNRAAGCGAIDGSLLKEVSYCLNIWDTTPCQGAPANPLPPRLAD